MPSYRGLSVRILSGSPTGTFQKPCGLEEYAKCTHTSLQQATCFIEAVAGTRFFICVEREGPMPQLHLSTIHGGLKRLYEKGIFTALEDVDDIKLEYDYIVSVHIDGNPRSEACHTYSRHHKGPLIISQGLKPADFAGNHVWPYNWHFQYLTKQQKLENNAVTTFKRMAIVDPTADSAQASPHSDAGPQFAGVQGGKIEVRIARAITSGMALPRQDDYWQGKTFNPAATESSDVMAIDATHCVSSVPGRNINMPCRNFTDPEVRNIDPHSHPYATFVFHYRDGVVLEEKGIKPSMNRIRSAQPTVLGKKKRQMPDENEDGRCGNSDDEEEVEYLLHRSLIAAFRPEVKGHVQPIDDHDANTATTSSPANASFTFRCDPNLSQKTSDAAPIPGLTLRPPEELQGQAVHATRKPLVDQNTAFSAFTASLAIRTKRRNSVKTRKYPGSGPK